MTLQHPVEELVQSSDRPLLFIASRWQRVALGEIAEVISGYAFQSRYFNDLEGFPLVRIRDLSSAKPAVLYSGPVPDGFWIVPGDILVGLDGDFRLHRWDGPRALLNQRVARIRAHETVFASKLIERVLPAYLELLRDNTSSITVRHLSLGDLKKIPLPFPPLPEQARIIKRLDEFEERASLLENGLRTASDQTEAAQEDAYRNAFRSEGDDWTWTTLGEIANIKPGLALGRKFGAADLLVEHPYLRVANVQRGIIDLSDVKSMMVRPGEVDRYKLAAGDILMNEGGDRDKLGRGWVWDDEIPGCLYQNHVFRVRLKDDVSVTPKYVSRYANYCAQGHFFQLATQTSNLASISARNVALLPIPVPPAGRAVQIDRLLDASEATINDIQREISRARTLLARLRDAVLAKAISGELTQALENDGLALPLPATTRPVRSRSKGKTGVQSKTGRISIVAALREHKRPMTPEQLFVAAGYVADNVEDFYQELQLAVDGGDVGQTADKLLSATQSLDRT